MPLQNRVTPFGEVIATPARGLLMGNRGGRLHDGNRTLGTRRWVSEQWICCKLAFNDRHRTVWGDSYTELFFLDEVTALAAGHRPCFECRRKDAEKFAALFGAVDTSSAHSRASGNPASQSRAYESVSLGPRFPPSRSALRRTPNAPKLAKRAEAGRGDERIGEQRIRAPAMDEILHAERLNGKAKRLHRCAIDALPDGAMLARGGEAFAVRGNGLLRWTSAGYRDALPRPRGGDVEVLTPPSILAVLASGYAPLWHTSAA